MANVRLEGLIKRYDGDVLAVDSLDLEVRAGELVVLVGPSGCGKSTTLRMIAGVEMQDSGEIYVDGNLICDTVHRVPPELREIGLMFQDFALFPHLTVAQNVAFGLKRGKITERVHLLLEKVGMSAHFNDYPHQLSGGEQQRVAIAVKRNVADQLRVAARLALHPEFLAGATPKMCLAGFDR